MVINFIVYSWQRLLVDMTTLSGMNISPLEENCK